MCTQDLQEAKLICLQCVSVENNLALKILLEWRYQDVNKHMWMHLKSLKQVPWYSGKKKINPSTDHIVVEKAELHFPSNLHTTQKCEGSD